MKIKRILLAIKHHHKNYKTFLFKNKDLIKTNNNIIK